VAPNSTIEEMLYLVLQYDSLEVKKKRVYKTKNISRNQFFLFEKTIY